LHCCKKEREKTTVRRKQKTKQTSVKGRGEPAVLKVRTTPEDAKGEFQKGEKRGTTVGNHQMGRGRGKESKPTVDAGSVTCKSQKIVGKDTGKEQSSSKHWTQKKNPGGARVTAREKGPSRNKNGSSTDTGQKNHCRRRSDSLDDVRMREKGRSNRHSEPCGTS